MPILPLLELYNRNFEPANEPISGALQPEEHRFDEKKREDHQLADQKEKYGMPELSDQPIPYFRGICVR